MSGSTTSDDSPRFLFVGHGGFSNRGCEAIVRATCSLLRARFPGAAIQLASFRPQEDSVHQAAEGLEVLPHTRTMHRFGLSWLAYQALKRGLRLTAAAERYRYGPISGALGEADAVLSIGGDNYTMDYGGLTRFLALNERVYLAGRPLVIWGASIGPFPDPAVLRAAVGNLAHASLITARETTTVRYLAEHGVSENVRLVADPAFLLPPEPVATAGFWPAGQLILALNVSPLLQRYHTGTGPDPFPELAVAAVRRAVLDLDMGVLLVPHVIHAGSSDYEYLRSILGQVSLPGRVTLAPNGLNACQLKHVISQCDLLMAGRTHATIAGFSSCVPTISLGYSTKALGINRDLFGDDRWVVDSRRLQSADELMQALRRLVAEREMVRAHLLSQRPVMVERAQSGVTYLAQLLGEEDHRRWHPRQTGPNRPSPRSCPSTTRHRTYDGALSRFGDRTTPTTR
jgi:polysaccharide pyruvyl transferase WcaK-like protein